MIKPILNSISTFYLLFLILLLFLSIGNIHSLLNWIDNSLGLQIHLGIFAEECSLTSKNVYDKFDRFVLAHLIGWMLKGMIVRDRFPLWLVSIGWEILEENLAFMIPNFAECWWDKWLMDVLVCNWIGMEIGLFLCDYLGFPRFNWTASFFQLNVILQKLKTIPYRLLSGEWRKLEWESNHVLYSFFCFHVLLFGMVLPELNAFTLKLFFLIPTTHYWNLIRVLLFKMLSGLIMDKFYQCAVAHQPLSFIGLTGYLYFLLIAVECILVWQHLPEHSMDDALSGVYTRLCLMFYFLLMGLVMLREKASPSIE